MGTMNGWRGVLLRDDVGRRDWVDFVKGAAMILIVAYHVALFLTSIGVDAAGIGRARIVLELFPMPAFFLISGLFHARMSTWTFGELWRRRLRQYLYLYVLWSLIRFVFYVVAPNVRSDGAGTTASDPLALVLIFVWPISSYWFIYALFVFTLAVWLFRRAPAGTLLVISGIVAALSSSGVLDTGNSSLNRMTEYLFFFVIGATFHRRIYDVVAQTRPWKVVVVSIAFVGVAAIATFLPVIGRTAKEAADKLAELDQWTDLKSAMPLLEERIGHNLADYDPDGPLPDLPISDQLRSRAELLTALARRENLTIRQLALRVAAGRGHHIVLGTPVEPPRGDDPPAPAHCVRLVEAVGYLRPCQIFMK